MNHKEIMKQISFLTAAALVTVIMLLIYATVQQVYRTGLDDPQTQLVKDIGLQLEQGRSAQMVVNDDSFDITRSLSPFIILYDAQGKPLRSNAFLDGKMPEVPVGVFEEVKRNGEHAFSWQPRKGVRMAMVIIKTNAMPVQFVAAGRSMAAVEQRIKNLVTMVFIAWIICMAIIAVAAAVYYIKQDAK